MLTQGQTRWSILPSPTMSNPSLLGMLAASFLVGQPSVEGIVARGDQVFGRSWPWLRPLAKRYVKEFAGRTRPRRRDAVQFLRDDPGFRQAWSKYFHELTVARRLMVDQQMPPVSAARWLTDQRQLQPVSPAVRWDLPVVESVGALAEWLALTIGELEWSADLK